LQARLVLHVGMMARRASPAADFTLRWREDEG
jgi:hypothetical protein